MQHRVTAAYCCLKSLKDRNQYSTHADLKKRVACWVQITEMHCDSSKYAKLVCVQMAAYAEKPQVFEEGIV